MLDHFKHECSSFFVWFTIPPWEHLKFWKEWKSHFFLPKQDLNTDCLETKPPIYKWTRMPPYILYWIKIKILSLKALGVFSNQCKGAPHTIHSQNHLFQCFLNFICWLRGKRRITEQDLMSGVYQHLGVTLKCWYILTVVEPLSV